MTRREFMAAAAAAITPASGVSAPGWVPIVKADEPSCNGYVNPAAVLAAAAAELPPCPVVLGNREAAPEIGRVAAWAFADGWLCARLEVPAAVGADLAALRAVARPAVFIDHARNRVTRIRGVKYVYVAPASGDEPWVP